MCVIKEGMCVPYAYLNHYVYNVSIGVVGLLLNSVSYPWKAIFYLAHIVNTRVVTGLVGQGAKASAALALTYFPPEYSGYRTKEVKTNISVNN